MQKKLCELEGPYFTIDGNIVVCEYTMAGKAHIFSDSGHEYLTTCINFEEAEILLKRRSFEEKIDIYFNGEK